MIFVAGMLCCKYNFFQKLHEYRRKKLKFICLSALLCAGLFLYHKIDLKIFWEFRYTLVPFLLILFCVEYLFRITPVFLVPSVSGQAFHEHLAGTYICERFSGKICICIKKFWLIPVAVLVISLGISYCLDFLKKITGYQKLIRLLKKKVTEHYAVRE